VRSTYASHIVAWCAVKQPLRVVESRAATGAGLKKGSYVKGSPPTPRAGSRKHYARESLEGERGLGHTHRASGAREGARLARLLLVRPSTNRRGARRLAFAVALCAATTLDIHKEKHDGAGARRKCIAKGDGAESERSDGHGGPRGAKHVLRN